MCPIAVKLIPKFTGGLPLFFNEHFVTTSVGERLRPKL